MPWNSIQLPNLLVAMNACDALGLARFRALNGAFQPAKDRHVYYADRGPYEIRPLVAAAYANLVPHAPHLNPSSFTTNDAHDLLVQRFGFQARQI